MASPELSVALPIPTTLSKIPFIACGLLNE
jgi:hypothetical protein